MATARTAQYQYSNTARRLGELPDYDNRGLKKLNGAKPVVHHRGLEIGYVIFVAIALITVAMILVRYVSIKSDITNSLNHISALEAQLNELKLENDATYSRINGNIDLEQIRDTAINELGMTYAKEGQTQTFVSEDGDYVRQLAKIP